MRKMPMRSCEPIVVRCRLIASTARVKAVEKPMQYSVFCTSLSMVFGTARTGRGQVSQTVPAAADADDVEIALCAIALRGTAVDDRFNDGIKPRNVAAARKNADAFGCHVESTPTNRIISPPASYVCP